jgi:hypothetical protein
MQTIATYEQSASPSINLYSYKAPISTFGVLPHLNGKKTKTMYKWRFEPGTYLTSRTNISLCFYILYSNINGNHRTNISLCFYVLYSNINGNHINLRALC